MKDKSMQLAAGLVLVLFMALIFVPLVVTHAQLGEDSAIVTILAPSTQTGDGGTFSFVNLPAGTYTLTAYMKSGMGNALGTVTVTLGVGEHNGSVVINASAAQATGEALKAAKNATVSYNSSAPPGTGSISGNARILMGPTYVGVPGITVLITGYNGTGSLEEYAHLESAPATVTCEGGYLHRTYTERSCANTRCGEGEQCIGNMHPPC